MFSTKQKQGLLLLLGVNERRRWGGISSTAHRTAAWTNWISGLINSSEVGEKLNGRSKNNFLTTQSHSCPAVQFNIYIYINNFFLFFPLFTGQIISILIKIALYKFDSYEWMRLDCTFRRKRSQVPELLTCTWRLKAASSTIICLHSNRPSPPKKKKKMECKVATLVRLLLGSAESRLVSLRPEASSLCAHTLPAFDLSLFNREDLRREREVILRPCQSQASINWSQI